MSTEIQTLIEMYCPGSQLTGAYAIDSGRLIETIQIAGPRLYGQYSSVMDYNVPEEVRGWVIERLISDLQRQAITAYGLKEQMERQINDAVQVAVRTQRMKTLSVINRFQQSARAMGNTLELGMLDQIANEI